MKVRVLGVRKLRNMIERVHPLLAVTQVTRQGTTTSNLLKARTQHATQGWDDDKAWSSQEWKADELMDDRTGKPVVCPQRGTHAFQSRFSREHKHFKKKNHDRTSKPFVCPQRGAQQFVFEDDETESELSLGSRSFLNGVNDQVRKRQKLSSLNLTEDSEKHSVI